MDDDFGSKFSMEGLIIFLDRTEPKRVRSKLGLYYEGLPNGSNSLLPKAQPEDELAEVKVYVGVYAKDEKIRYSDALPFALN
jgi:hypothetical protein